MSGKAQRLITVIVIPVRQPNFAFCRRNTCFMSGKAQQLISVRQPNNFEFCILNFELKKTEGSFEPSVFSYAFFCSGVDIRR